VAINRPKRARAGVAARDSDDERWADLADHVLIIAREIQFRGYTDECAVPLSQSEGMVMRYLQRDPAAPPSQIAAATGLQRTNLSTVLRGLEQKALIERRVSPDDRRGVTVHLTERGQANYALVRREWAAAVSAAAGGDTRNLRAALSLLTRVEAGLIRTRPGSDGARPAT
jgi:DNA-binding MarR family transcriptional regulator